MQLVACVQTAVESITDIKAELTKTRMETTQSLQSMKNEMRQLSGQLNAISMVASSAAGQSARSSQGTPYGASPGIQEGAVQQTPAAAPAASPLLVSGLKWKAGADAMTHVKLGTVTCVELMKLHLNKKLNVRRSDQSRVNLTVGCFKAVGTQEELKILTKGSELEIATTLNSLHDRVVARLILAHNDVKSERLNPTGP